MPTKTHKNKPPAEKKLSSAPFFMPQDSLSQHVLRERAKSIAKQTFDNGEKKQEIPYIRFRLGKCEQYGIPYQYANEVTRDNSLTIIPCASPLIAGIINHRGALIAVLDLKQFFNTQVMEYDKKAYIIVTTWQDITVGIRADNIEGSDTYDPNALDTPLPTEGIIKQPDYIIGLHQGITAIINIQTILSSAAQQIRNYLS